MERKKSVSPEKAIQVFPFRRASWLSILIALNVAMLVMNGFAMWKIYLYQAEPPSLLDVFLRRPTTPQLIDYKDFISIMISGLSLMVTVLGLGLATVAVWGTSTLKQEARVAAERVASEDATKVATRVARDVAQSTAARAMRPIIENVGVGDTDALVRALTSEDATSVDVTPDRDGGAGHVSDR